MRHLTKERFLLSFGAVTLILCILSFLATMNTITKVSAVEGRGVGVYWNSDCSDSDKVSSIDWGTLNPGSVKNVAVYIRNDENHTIYLTLSTKNWNPPNASKYLSLGWNYTPGRRINPGEVLPITLSLSVSRQIEGISSFGFSIFVVGSETFPGDVDKDGDCDADDVFCYMAPAYGSKIGDPNYDPNCDFDGDGYVSADDVFIYLAPNYGKSP